MADGARLACEFPDLTLVLLHAGMLGTSSAEAIAALRAEQPVIDGDVLPARPIDRIVAGAGAGVDVLIGTNTDE